MNDMRTDQHDYDNVVKELDEIKKDPKKWEDFMAMQAAKALRHWPGRKKR
jgi:hypothetical protein